jgi:hypothetical protein
MGISFRKTFMLINKANQVATVIWLATTYSTCFQTGTNGTGMRDLGTSRQVAELIRRKKRSPGLGSD